MDSSFVMMYFGVSKTFECHIASSKRRSVNCASIMVTSSTFNPQNMDSFMVRVRVGTVVIHLCQCAVRLN